MLALTKLLMLNAVEPIGQEVFTGNSTWVVPEGVTSICAVAVESGVYPLVASQLTVDGVVVLRASGAANIGDGGGQGGPGGDALYTMSVWRQGGAGGAGGYLGNGGAGGRGSGGTGLAGAAGSGAAGGGAGGTGAAGYNGGGVGLQGIGSTGGASGNVGVNGSAIGPTFGHGIAVSTSGYSDPRRGGSLAWKNNIPVTPGQIITMQIKTGGAIRIIWGGGRSFPHNALDMDPVETGEPPQETLVTGQQVFTAAADWVVPPDVHSISIVAIDSGTTDTPSTLKRGAAMLVGAGGDGRQVTRSGGGGGVGKRCTGWNGSSTYNYWTRGGGGGAGGYNGMGGQGGDGDYYYSDGFGTPTSTPGTPGQPGSSDGARGGNASQAGGGTGLRGTGSGAPLYGGGRPGISDASHAGLPGGTLRYLNGLAVIPGETLSLSVGGNGAMRIMWGGGRSYPYNAGDM